jgi:hypothetical protein
MARGKKSKTVFTVKHLKEFIADIPDSVPIRGTFDERVRGVWYKADKDESGPRQWIVFEEVER